MKAFEDLIKDQSSCPQEGKVAQWSVSSWRGLAGGRVGSWQSGFMEFLTTSSTPYTNRSRGGVRHLPLLVGSLLIISPTDSISVSELPMLDCPATRPVPRNNSQASGVDRRGLDADL